MILLDIHVLSEFMWPASAAQVVAWLDAQAPEHVGVCAVTRAEIELGVSLLADGQRKLNLHPAVTAMLTEEFAGRCAAHEAEGTEFRRTEFSEARVTKQGKNATPLESR